MKLFAAALNFRSIVHEFELPETFPPELHKQAAEATDRFADQRQDLREVEFVTIDPPSSMDLDQAVHIEREPEGYRVRYAIADVAAFVTPGSALEAETIRRGQTIYVPDDLVRLHPVELSEGSASLLPEVDRPAVVWDMHLDGDGEVVDFTVFRALVQSRAKLNYEGVQADFEAGRLHPAIELLPEVGRLRQSSDARRRAINLRLPSVTAQQVPGQTGGAAHDGPEHGGPQKTYELQIDPRQEVNDFNAELSLMAGLCAGQMMVDAGYGIVRTLPPAKDKDLVRFDKAARALGFELGGRHPGRLLDEVDASTPRGMALMLDATTLLRGSGYVAFGFGGDGTPEVHAGVGSYYAHVTAPLRRLVDRFATEICLSIAAGVRVPEWVTGRVDEVVEAMARTSPIASRVDKACLQLTQAVVLEPWVGQNFQAAVLRSEPEKKQPQADIFVEAPPVMADCMGAPAEGEAALVTLGRADPAQREVLFAWPAD